MRKTIKLKYTTGFRTGNKALDVQVRILVGLFQDLMDAYGEERAADEVLDMERTALEYLERYVEQQEAEMEQRGYPAIGNHRLHHRKFALQLKQITAQDDIAQRLIDYAAFVEEFIEFHVMVLDKDFSRFYRAADDR